MQAEMHPEFRGNVPPEIQEMMDNEVEYNEKRMFNTLNHESVKAVRVFKAKRKKKNRAAKTSRRKNR